VGSLRRFAYRPLPSMMIATDCATSGDSRSGNGLSRRSDQIRLTIFTLS